MKVYQVTFETLDLDKDGDKKSKHVFVAAETIEEALDNARNAHPNWEITAIYNESDEFIA